MLRMLCTEAQVLGLQASLVCVKVGLAVQCSSLEVYVHVLDPSASWLVDMPYT